MAHWHQTDLRTLKEHRRRAFISRMDRPDPAQLALGRAAIGHLSAAPEGTGLADALAGLEATGIEVRPNVWAIHEIGGWALNGIRFVKGDIAVTTGQLGATRLFGPGEPLAFVPERDGAALYEMRTAFEARRGRTAQGRPRPDEPGGRTPPKRPRLLIDWQGPDVVPEDREVYGLLVHADGHRRPVVALGRQHGDTFVDRAGSPVSPPWTLDGWLDLGDACVPGAMAGDRIDAAKVLPRGAGISDGLRVLVARTNAEERPLDLFEYRMTVGRDAWSSVMSEDLRPMAQALCDEEEVARLSALPSGRRRMAMRSIARGFDPGHAIGYEESRLAYLERHVSAAFRPEPDYPQP